MFLIKYDSRRVWRYQRGYQKPYIEEQTTQWPKEKGQKDKQRSTKHTYKTKDRVTRTPLKTGGELRYSGRVGSSCSTIGTRRVNLVTNPVISQSWMRKGPRSVYDKWNIYGGHLWHIYSITVNQVMVATVKFSKCIYTTFSIKQKMADIIHSKLTGLCYQCRSVRLFSLNNLVWPVLILIDRELYHWL